MHSTVHKKYDRRETYREHATQWAWEHAHELNYGIIENDKNHAAVKLSLDDEVDYEILKLAFEKYGDDVSWRTIVKNRAMLKPKLSGEARSRLYAKP
jgi:hypothetical protein